MRLKKAGLAFALFAMLIVVELSSFTTGYGEDSLRELDDLRYELLTRGISTRVVEGATDAIKNASRNEDYSLADHLTDQTREYCYSLIAIDSNLTYLEKMGTAIEASGGEFESDLRAARFELGLGNEEESKRLLLKSKTALTEIYALKKKTLVTDLRSIEPRRKALDLSAEFGNALNASDYEGVVIFSRETKRAVSSEEEAKKTKVLLEEYGAIAKSPRFVDGLLELEMDLEVGNYQRADELSNSLAELAHLANESAAKMTEVIAKNYTLESARAKIALSQDYFKKELFAESLAAAQDAARLGEEALAQERLLQGIRRSPLARFAGFIARHVVASVVALLLVGAILYFEYSKIVLKLNKHRLRMLERRKRDIEEMIRGIQRRHYIERKMPGKMYTYELVRLQERLARTKERMEYLKEDKE